MWLKSVDQSYLGKWLTCISSPRYAFLLTTPIVLLYWLGYFVIIQRPVNSSEEVVPDPSINKDVNNDEFRSEPVNDDISTVDGRDNEHCENIEGNADWFICVSYVKKKNKASNIRCKICGTHTIILVSIICKSVYLICQSGVEQSHHCWSVIFSTHTHTHTHTRTHTHARIHTE